MVNETTASDDRPASQRIPVWASDPDFIASIEAGHIEIDDEYMGER
ncbi:hypothetical protein ACWENS_10435 [Streptomyces sp. NPDC004532]